MKLSTSKPVETYMLTFKVNDMTCGHCVSNITKAIQGVDRAARVTIDLTQHLVTVEPTEADASDLSDAITQAGYTPELLHSGAAVSPVTSATSAQQPSKSGSCCGCR